MNKGYTLIELLVFIAIFSTIVVFFITIFLTILNVQTNQSAAAEVSQQSQFLLQQLQYYISSARLADMSQDVSSSLLTLRDKNLAQFTIGQASSAGPVYLTLGGGTPQALTSGKVSISGLTFSR